MRCPAAPSKGMTFLPIQDSEEAIINSGIPATNNFVACVTLINKELKKNNAKERKDWTTEEFETAIKGLEKILNTLTKRYRGVLSVKAKG
jgi:hypothetical protein